MGNMLEPRTPQQDMQSSANVAAFLARVGACSVEPFLHKHFGVNYFGLQAFAVLIVAPVFGALAFPHHNLMPLMVFLGLYLLAVLRAKGEAQRLRARGVNIHTRFNGWPRSLKLSASAEQEQRCKSIGEPLLVGIWGTLIYLGFNQPLGAWLIFAACSLGVSNGMYRMRVQRQVDDMSDAMIEQEMLAEEVRRMRG